jgi:hypothetical protein
MHSINTQKIMKSAYKAPLLSHIYQTKQSLNSGQLLIETYLQMAVACMMLIL